MEGQDVDFLPRHSLYLLERIGGATHAKRFNTVDHAKKEKSPGCPYSPTWSTRRLAQYLKRFGSHTNATQMITVYGL